MVAESESDFNSDPVQIDDCRFGPTYVNLEIDPPRQILGYEWWDNEERKSDSDRAKFQWRNVGSTGDMAQIDK